MFTAELCNTAKFQKWVRIPLGSLPSIYDWEEVDACHETVPGLISFSSDLNAHSLMSNSKPNYWSYRIYRQGFDGQPQFVAAYLAETDRDSLAADIASEDSRLRRDLERIFRIDV